MARLPEVVQEELNNHEALFTEQKKKHEALFTEQKNNHEAGLRAAESAFVKAKEQVEKEIKEIQSKGAELRAQNTAVENNTRVLEGRRNSEIAQLDAQVEQNKKTIQEQDMKVAGLKGQGNTLESQLKNLDELRKTLNAECDSLVAAKVRAHNQYEELEADLESAKQRYKREEVAMVNRLSELSAKIEQSIVALRDLGAAAENSMKKTELYKQDIAVLAAEKGALSREIEELKQKKQNALLGIPDVERQRAELNSARQKLDDDRMLLNGQTAELRRRASDLDKREAAVRALQAK